MQVEAAADHVSEPFAEHADGFRLLRPQRVEKRVPGRWFRRVFIVVEWDGCLVEELRCVGKELLRFDIEQAVGYGHDCPGCPSIEPTRLMDVVGQDADRGQGLEQVADLAAIGGPGHWPL